MQAILPLFCCLQPVLSKTQCKQLALILQAILSLSGACTQRNIPRWTQPGGSYRTLQRFFHTNLNWLELNWLFFSTFLYRRKHTYLLVGDATVIKKAGKKTFGVGRFYSSVAKQPIPSVAFFAFSLVDVEQRRAYPLYLQQIVRTQQEIDKANQDRLAKRAKKTHKANQKQDQDTPPPPKKPRGRPTGSKNKNKEEVTLSAHLSRILEWGQQVMARISSQMSLKYLVLDGEFGNHYAYQMTKRLGLCLISKMHHNAQLYLEPTKEQKQGRPNLKYGTRVDYANLPQSNRVRCVEAAGIQTECYQMRCRHKDFADLLNIVVVVHTDLATKRRGHCVLFSGDLSLAAATLVDYYSLRFQIEFNFRDGKQHFGLGDFQATDSVAIANSVGVSMLCLLVSEHLLEDLRKESPHAGIQDLKSSYRGAYYVRATLKYLPFSVSAIILSGLEKRIRRLGCIHLLSKSSSRSDLCSESGWEEGEEGLLLAA